jgi:outer membrane biosynthesis protein TonB
MDFAVEQKINVKATVWTVIVHIVLLLLFLFIRYGTPVIETPVEMGMEVNLGTSDNGNGTDQPMAIEAPAPDAAVVPMSSAAQLNASNDEIVKTEEADAPVINTKPEKKVTVASTDNNKKAKQETINQTTRITNPTPRPRYVFNGNTGRGGNNATANMRGTSEGNTRGNGDRGVPSGTPGAANYTGVPGWGNGISHTLSGRSIVAFPNPDADFKESGRVVIRITVSREGAIVNKTVKSSTNAEIRAIALRKVDKVKFNKSDNAPEEQFGDITFVFKTHQ